MTTTAKKGKGKEKLVALPTKKSIPTELVAGITSLLAFAEGDAKRHAKELNSKKWYSVEALMYEASKIGIKNRKTLTRKLAANEAYNEYWDDKPAAEAQADAPAKGKDEKKSQTKKNLDKAAKSIATERTTNYNYPKNADAKDKKEFRRKARQSKEKYEKEIQALGTPTDKDGKKKLSELKSQFEIFTKETYLS